MEQEIQILKLKDLVLWTENPRDPIDENATDQDIVDKALEDKYSKWSLPKLAKDMGDHYDFSELPTVVFHGEKPVVYDGNRRIILGKIKHGLVSVDGKEKIDIPEIPVAIPCNVCAKGIALKNVYRKHSDSGSWHPLERDIFLHKFMGEKKSTFLIIEENTGLITAHPHLNQRFVKDEILREDMKWVLISRVISCGVFMMKIKLFPFCKICLKRYKTKRLLLVITEVKLLTYWISQ